MRLGTYTTIEVPIKNEKEAYEFLKKEFEKIEGRVRTILNFHDLESYESFEIDYPYEIKNLVEKDNGGGDLTDEEYEKLVNWHTEANKIELEYTKKFNKFL